MKSPLRVRMRDFDEALWYLCQKVTYPLRTPSRHRPYRAEDSTPKVRPATWLYHQLLNNHELIRQVFLWRV